MPDPEYRAIDALSHSDLKAWVSGRQPEGRQLIVGSALHARVIFGKDYYLKRYFESPQEYNLRKKEEKQRFVEDQEISKSIGMDLLRKKEAEQITAMTFALYAHPVGRKAFGYKGYKELAVVANSLPGISGWPGYTGRVKCLVDLLGKGLCDIKTTGYADENQFKNAVVDYGYAVQAYAYREIYAAVSGEWLPFKFLCVSKREPHNVWVMQLTPEQEAFGGRWWHDMLTIYARQKNGNVG